MTDFGQFFCYQNGALTPVSEPPATDLQLAVADSWLVENGRARHMDRHFKRFADWVLQTHPNCSNQLDGFFAAVTAVIPREGRWFPRLELHAEQPADSNLFLRMREAPEQLGAMTLWTYPEVDPRRSALVKGPDLSLCMQMRRKAQLHGADEAVLLDANGFISEGALSSIVWWRGDVLCAPGPDVAWLDSITRQEVFELAEQMGFLTRFEKAKPADLVETEVWGLSSLQSIRPVTNWIDLGGPLGQPRHIEAFAKRLRLLSKLID